jgi:hypothetical protein
MLRRAGPGGQCPERTLRTRSNLAATVHDTEGAAAALPLYHDILAAQERTLGPGHPSTLHTRVTSTAPFGSQGTRILDHERTRLS